MYIKRLILYFYLSIIDHPIHPPKNDRDPWECEFLPDNGYVFYFYSMGKISSTNEVINVINVGLWLFAIQIKNYF